MTSRSHEGPEETRLHTLARKVWRRLALRNLTASDNHRQLDRLYAVADPWQMTSPREQFRFQATNAVIAQRIGHVGSLLEVGCGEGHQSEHLMTLTDQLYGLDVSARAIERARVRLPNGRFDVGTVASIPSRPPTGRFDLVVAWEVLYYMSDIPAAVHAMSEAGDACLVTFFGPSAGLVAKHVDQLPGAERGWFFHEPFHWLWVYWRPQR